MKVFIAVSWILLRLSIEIHAETNVTWDQSTAPAEGETEAVPDWPPACGAGRPAVLEEAPGRIASVSYDNGTYVNQQHCAWLLKAPDGQVVQLSVTNFDLDTIFPCLWSNFTVFDEDREISEHSLGMFCGQDNPGTLHSSWRYLLVVFKAGDRGTGTGFEADFNFVPITEAACSTGVQLNWPVGGFTSPRWPADYPPNANCRWTVTEHEEYRVEFIDWSLPERNRDFECEGDYLRVSDGSFRLNNTYCGQHAPDPIGLNEESLLFQFVSAPGHAGYTEDGGRNAVGFRTRYQYVPVTDWACSTSGPALLDFDPGSIMSPADGANRTCRWRLSTTVGKLIVLHKLLFDLPSTPSVRQCDTASLSIYDGEYETSRLIGTYCGDGWKDDIEFSGLFGLLVFKSQTMRDHRGFHLEYSYGDVTERACGKHRPAVLGHKQAVIGSPYYGKGNYPPDSNCQWRIGGNYIGEVVRIDFLIMNIVYCPACMCDWLQIYNGYDQRSSQSIAKHCSNTAPRSVTTTVNEAYVTFHSDASSRTDGGFKLQYRIFNLSDIACDRERHPAVMSHEPGDIVSPFDDEWDGYPTGADCWWKIAAADPSKVVALTFNKFDVEPDEGVDGNRCMFDRVVAYDGPDNTSSVLGVFCGRDIPPSVTSSGNTLLVKFVTNMHHDHSQGFHASYTFTEPTYVPPNKYLALLILVPVLLCVVVLLVTYCKFPDKLRKLPALFSRSDEDAATDQTHPNTDNEDDSTRQQHRRRAPPQANAEGRQCGDRSSAVPSERPPSYTETQETEHYYSLADYPPPAYDEIGNTAHVEGHRHEVLNDYDNVRESINLERDRRDVPLSTSSLTLEIRLTGGEVEPRVHYSSRQSIVSHQSSHDEPYNAAASVAPFGMADIGASLLTTAGTGFRPGTSSSAIQAQLAAIPEHVETNHRLESGHQVLTNQPQRPSHGHRSQQTAPKVQMGALQRSRSCDIDIDKPKSEGSYLNRSLGNIHLLNEHKVVEIAGMDNAAFDAERWETLGVSRGLSGTDEECSTVDRSCPHHTEV